MRPEILQQMLQTVRRTVSWGQSYLDLFQVLNIIMFEDCRNQWSMSRPLLGLILLNEEYFQVSITSNCLSANLTLQNLRDQIISSQPGDKRAAMMTWFENLMDGIERNLLTKNRDRFTQNLSVFRR